MDKQKAMVDKVVEYIKANEGKITKEIGILGYPIYYIGESLRLGYSRGFIISVEYKDTLPGYSEGKSNYLRVNDALLAKDNREKQEKLDEFLNLKL